MQTEMHHAVYGSRVISDDQIVDYEHAGWSKGPEVAPELVDGTVNTVLATVGNDPQAARLALAAEQDRSAPRTSLVTALARIAEPNQNPEI